MIEKKGKEKTKTKSHHRTATTQGEEARLSPCMKKRGNNTLRQSQEEASVWKSSEAQQKEKKNHKTIYVKKNDKSCV